MSGEYCYHDIRHNVKLEISKHTIMPEATATKWSPTKLWELILTGTVCLAICKITIFRLFAGWDAHYFGMAEPNAYAKIILLAFIISAPFGIFRKCRAQTLAFLCADAVCAIKVWSALGPWLGIASLSLMLLTTIALHAIMKRPVRLTSVPLQGRLQYCGYLLAWSLLSFFLP